MSGGLGSMFELLVAILAPHACPGCGRALEPAQLPPIDGIDNVRDCLAKLRPERLFCDVCTLSLRALHRACPTCAEPAPEFLDVPVATTTCPSCAAQPPPYQRIVAAFEYCGASRDAVLLLKNQRSRQGAAALGLAVASELARSHIGRQVPVTFVPSTPSRLIARGFDPARVIAESTARALGLELVATLCRSDGPSQAGLSRNERHQNVKDAFSPQRLDTIPTDLILVDDVVASTATATAASRTLRDIGVQNVTVATFARARH